MPLETGRRLGLYEILSPLGAGGMGEVYRARDTRLGREVALKVLPAAFSERPDRISRFEREARLLASLNHPGIAAIHGLEEADGIRFLVLELVPGETLAEWLAGGTPGLRAVLEAARQIAEALAEAHERGIVHRDLKPANVKLTPDGKVKLLDFGLAKALDVERSPHEQSQSPTVSGTGTREGVILGTAPYMSPEQARGEELDKRTDIWSFGCVLYEMLTRRRAFSGGTVSDTIVSILEREPDWQALPETTPASVRSLLRRCLQKDRARRLRDVADAALEIEEALAGPVSASQPGLSPSSRRRPRWLGAAGLAGLLVALAAAGGLVWNRARVAASLSHYLAPRPPVVHTLLAVRPAEDVSGGSTDGATPGGSRTALDWTPDGRALVFVGRRDGVRQLYVRELSRDEAHPLAGSEGAQVPAVSTDGRWVAFWANRKIQRISILGGPTSVLVPELADPPQGMVWGPSGRLYYGGADYRIWRVAAEAKPEPVTSLQQAEITHGLPHLLPGEKALLFTLRRRHSTWGDEEIVAQDLGTGVRRVLLRDAADERYVRSGHIVFMRQGVLMAAAFDLDRLKVRGEPAPVLEGVGQALTESNSNNPTGAGQFAVSLSGTPAYVAGASRPFLASALVGVDRRGHVSPLAAPTRSYGFDLGLAPDGRRLAAVTAEIREQVRWIVDVSRGTLSRLPGGGESGWPRWTPDGQRVAFWRLANGVAEVVWQRADAGAAAEPLVRGDHAPSSWSPDGRHLATVLDDDIWIVTVAGSTPTLERLSETPAIEQGPEFSPDGRWLAYASNATGRAEIYVQPWPGRGPGEQVSLGGGESPAWNPSGGELFFLSHRGDVSQMWAVSVETGPRLRFGTPRSLFDSSTNELILLCVPVRCYAVSRDGGRFFATQVQPRPPAAPVTHVRIVQGWLEEMQARVGGEGAR